MGGLLGPADGMYHRLGVEWAERGVAVVRVSYRHPNDLEDCTIDLAAAVQLVNGAGAERVVVMGHSFGGAVAVRVGVGLAPLIGGVVTFATQSAGCEAAAGLQGTPLLLFHGERDEILPPEASEMVRMLAGTGEVVRLPGDGHLLAKSGDACGSGSRSGCRPRSGSRHRPLTSTRVEPVPCRGVRMQFQPYHELHGRPNVIVDGSPTDGTVLTVTHWPGYPPPEVVAADTSGEMAFRLLGHPELLAGVDLVSNNHFDQDGLVSIHALVEPDVALAHRPFLEDVARAGDFAVYRDRDAARVSMVLSAWADGRGGMELPGDYAEQTALLYGEWAPRLSELSDEIARHRELWAAEDETLTASEAVLTTAVSVVERPEVDLAIVDVPPDAPDAGGHRFGGDWVAGLHPMAVHNATERLVVATVRGRRYDVELRYESWVQLRSRPLRLRRDLAPLAARLQHEERGDAVWTATPVSRLVPRLASGAGDSSIERARFLDLLVDHLATAPPAWDPFSPTPGAPKSSSLSTSSR